MNLSTLKTLNDRQFYSGMGEIIKHGIIKDSSYFQWLKKNNSSIIDRDPIVLQEMIYRSCKIKREVVEKDPTELGDRALLNFGHTVGHAIEKLKNFELLHGECVALGMVAASYLSYQKGSITKEQLEDIITVIRNFKLPVSVSGLNAKEILNVMANDKKMESGRLKFIVLSEVGHAIIDSTITQDEMLNCIGFLLS
jgi:3-dehydroquinate synthase